MREDLIGAIKNAIEHGSTPQQAAQSLINSGYDPLLVQEALKYITSGTLASLSQPVQRQPRQIPVQSNQIPQQNNQNLLINNQIPQQQYNNPQQKINNQIQRPLPISKKQDNNQEKKWVKTVLLITILLALMATLLSLFLFKDKFLSIFG
jgi:hypothetical protein